MPKLAHAKLAPAKHAGVLSREDLDAYVRRCIEHWLTTHVDEDASALARVAGLTPTTISTVRSGKRGVGRQALIRFAKAFGTSTDGLIAGAESFATLGVFAAPEAPTRPDSVVVRDESDRYPERSKAIVAARALGLSEEAIADVSTWDLRDGAAMSGEDWLDQIRAEARRGKRLALQTPEAAARDKAAAIAEMDVAIAHEAKASADAKAKRDAIHKAARERDRKK